MNIVPHESKKEKAQLKRKLILPVMLLILALMLVLAASIGTVNVPFFQTVKIILKNLGIIHGGKIGAGYEAIIFQIRLPRVIIAALVGSALAISGAVMQGMFKNPMADPGILGVSSGASLGAVIAIALGLTSSSMYFLPLFAVIGSFGATIIVFLLASRRGKIPVLSLVLSGIAVSMFLGAITSIILKSMYEYKIKEFMLWTMGSLYFSRWEHVQLVFIPIILCIGLLLFFARDLNVLLMGEEEAQAVGLNPNRARKLLMMIVSIATASAVCVSGIISFVGLIVPHILRLIVGPDHKILLPASALGGAILIVGCDLLSRIGPTETGVGIVTSIIGAPYFLFLLIRARKEGGAL